MYFYIVEDEFFQNREEAGERLAQLLRRYKSDAVVFGLPRGGVIVGAVVARELDCPLDVVVAKKIGHPYDPEFAVGAVTPSGIMIGDKVQLSAVDQEWLRVELSKKQIEAQKALEFYTGRSFIQTDLSDKIALIVDDGIATGSTVLAAIEDIRLHQPKKILVGIPVIPKEAIPLLKERVDEVAAVVIPEFFLGSVGAYYDDFEQVEDTKVLEILEQSKKRYERTEN